MKEFIVIPKFEYDTLIKLKNQNLENKTPIVANTSSAESASPPPESVLYPYQKMQHTPLDFSVPSFVKTLPKAIHKESTKLLSAIKPILEVNEEMRIVYDSTELGSPLSSLLKYTFQKEPFTSRRRPRDLVQWIDFLSRSARVPDVLTKRLKKQVNVKHNLMKYFKSKN